MSLYDGAAIYDYGSLTYDGNPTSPLPQFQYLVAFNNGPLDDPTGFTTPAPGGAGTVGAAGYWTDITSYVRQHQIKRGRQHELGQFEAGTCTLDLANSDARFNPWNTTSPYNGLLRPRLPLRVNVIWNGTTYTRFTGHVNAWPVQWPDPVSAWAQVSATDALRLLAGTDLTSGKYQATVVADSPQAFYRLSDQIGVSTCADSSGNGYNGTYQGQVTLGAQGPLVSDLATAATFAGTPGGTAGGAAQASGSVTSLTGTGAFTVEAWFKTTSTDANFHGVVTSGQIVNTGTEQLFVAVYNGRLYAGGPASGVNAAAMYPTNTVADGGWHHVAMTRSSTGLVWTLYLDGAQIATQTVGAAVSLQSQVIWAGGDVSNTVTGGGGFDFNGSIADVAVYPSALTAAQIANHYKVGIAGLVQQTSGARVGAILDIIGWPTGARAVDTGNSQVQANTANLTTTSALTYLQQVEETEAGALFADTAGRVTFLSRGTLLSNSTYTASALTLSDAGGSAVPFQPGPTLTFDDVDIYNQAIVSRTGGVPQVAADTASQQAYGTVTWKPSGSTTLAVSDAESLSRAQYVVAKYKTPQVRLAHVTVQATDLLSATTPSGLAGVLAVNLMQRVTVTRTGVPGGGTTFTQVGVVEGMSETATPNSYQIDFELAPADTLAYWIVGDPVYGLAGQTTRAAF